MPKPKYKRRVKLIKPRLQMKLTFIFLGMSALSLLLQFILFMTGLTRVALELPEDGLILLDEMNGFLIVTLVTSFLLFLPLTFTIGVLTTFRIAGPLYRFEVFLKDVLNGTADRPCKIRKGDDLQDFCELLNQVTRPLREQARPESESSESNPKRPAA